MEKVKSPNHSKLLLLAVCALAMAVPGRLSADSPAERVLLAKAQSLIAHGHLDLAVQTWQQVLLSDPVNAEALLGIAKADMQLGKPEEAEKYVRRLRELGNNSADLAQIEAMPHVQPQSVRLNEASRLAQEGRYGDAIRIYREIFGNKPPPGDMARAYYETEAALPESRADAIDGLRDLAKQFSADPRYAIALGRILTYDPKTRAEGIALLKQFSDSPEAQKALKQAEGWTGDSGKPAAGSSVVSQSPAPARAAPGDPLEAAAYRALNSGHLDEAQQKFEAMLERQPNNAQALSGLGYVSMKRGDFAKAEDYLEKAHAAGAGKVDDALNTSRFWNRMTRAGEELKSQDAQTAAKDYRSALSLKPTNPDAEEGLADALMQVGSRAEAIELLRREVRASPERESAWRTLFRAQSETENWQDVLATNQSMPRDVRAHLETDPEYLRFLIQADLALGRQSDAERATDQALALPFPNQGRALSSDQQLQYAALLMTIRRFEPAIGLYRQVVADNPGNAGAWRALVAAEHQLKRDDAALAAVRSMPQAAYDESQNDAGFLALLGSIYQSRNELGSAQRYLERALSATSSPPPGIELQLAGVYLAEGDLQKAYSIYRRELDQDSSSSDAWRGLLTLLHQSKRDREALQELASIPDSARLGLEKDPSYLQTLASIQSAAGQNRAALETFEQLSQIYLDQRVEAPADVEIQYGWLLLKSGDDRRLYSLISRLADSPELTEDQQANLNKLWASWSMRRADMARTTGDQRRALAILETTARAFPRNADVYSALAAEYQQVGQVKRAVAIYASLDLRHATMAQYRGAISAALAAHDMKRAELWLQAALDLYKTDPTILKMAAQYEQERGDVRRAAAYYRAALDAMGPDLPGEMLSHSGGADDPADGNSATRDLMRLLAPTGPGARMREDLDRGGQEEENGIAMQEEPRANVATLGGFAESGSESGEDTRDAASTVSRLGDPPTDIDPYSAPDPPLGAQTSRSRASLQTADDRSSPIQSATRDQRHNNRLSLPESLGEQTSIGDEPHIASSLDDPPREAPSKLPRDLAYLQAQDGAQDENSGRPSLPGQALDQSDPDAVGNLQDAVKSMEGPAPESGKRSDANELAGSQLNLDDHASDEPALEEGQRGEVASSVLPPLTGVIVSNQAPKTPREQIQEQVAVLEGEFSSWIGGTSGLDYRSGQPGLDQLAMYSAQAEASTMIGPGIRTTLIVKPVLLDAGTATGTATFQQGTLPATAVPYVQSAAGEGGELQLQTAFFGVRAGVTPRGFLIENFTGGLSIHPPSSHFKLDFSRDPILDTQLSFAGLRDEGSASPTYVGNVWGGVVSNVGELGLNYGDSKSGWYVQGGGQFLSGVHVPSNKRIDGDGGAYWAAWHNPEFGSLTVGMNFFGMHYERNLRYFTYGQGGYFSPGAYVVASAPLTFTGHYGPNFHYRVMGSLGMQAFQEDSAPYFPLDPAIQAAQGNPFYAERTSVGGNYNLEMEASYAIAEHWYVGGYTAFNNSSDYASDKVGFFVRFLPRPEPVNEETGPTGLFPHQGMRPLHVP